MVDEFSDRIHALVSSRNICCAVLFGSYCRFLFKKRYSADYSSDIDLQFLVDDPSCFETKSWMSDNLQEQCSSYALQNVFGGAKKATIVFPEVQIDVVIVGIRRLHLARLILMAPCIRDFGWVKILLRSFADLMRYDHLVIKGGGMWGRFYMVAASIGGRLSLTDEEAEKLVGIAFSEGLSAIAKVGRGEHIAACRIIYGVVVETNLRLVQEIRERQGSGGFHRGRRAEDFLEAYELDAVMLKVDGEDDEVVRGIANCLLRTGELYYKMTGRHIGWRLTI